MPTYAIVLDTETGGLDARLHPLLSVSLLLVDIDTFTVIEHFYIYVDPPDSTVVETSAGFVDRHGRVVQAPLFDTQFVITKTAADLAKFSWDAWRNKGVPLWQADKSFREFLDQWFSKRRQAPVFAYNAPFDEAFIKKYLPRAYDKMERPFVCVYRTFKMLCSRYLPRKPENFKLASVYHFVKRQCPEVRDYLREGDSAHDAFVDTEMCLTVLHGAFLIARSHNTRASPCVA